MGWIRVAIATILLSLTLMTLMYVNEWQLGSFIVTDTTRPLNRQTWDSTDAIFGTIVSTDTTDWSFSTKRSCPSVNYADYPCPRRKLALECNGRNGSVFPLLSLSNRTDDIYQVSLESKCLSKFIELYCGDENLVPNVVHYVWCKKHELGFFHFLSFMSALRFIKPCLILFHGDFLPFGKYWNFFISDFHRVIHVQRKCPDGFGFLEHASDVMRIEALMAFGGIYLDWDEIVLRPVENLRKYNYTQGYEESYFMGSQFIMAKRNATFLQHWYRSYFNDYRKKSWTYNALEVPVKLAKQFPELIHIEGYNFAWPSWQHRNLIYFHNYNWTTNYAMHLFLRDYKTPTDEIVIRNLNTTIGAISRHVLYGNKELCIDF